MSHADATIAVVGLMLAAANPHFSRRVGQVRASRRCVSASRVRCWPHAVTFAKRFPANEDPPTHGLARRTLHRGEKSALAFFDAIQILFGPQEERPASHGRGRPETVG